MKNKTKKYYLAYGSNLNVEQMARRCPGAEVVGTAFIEGYELLFKGSKTGSYLTIEQSPDSRVPVAVWAVNGAHEAALDRYEGFPTFYYKKNFKVKVKYPSGRSRTVTAFAYIMHEDHILGCPGQWYVDVCAEGYQFFGFDLQYLRDAVNVSVRRRRAV